MKFEYDSSDLRVDEFFHLIRTFGGNPKIEDKHTLRIQIPRNCCNSDFLRIFLLCECFGGYLTIHGYGVSEVDEIIEGLTGTTFSDEEERSITLWFD